MNLFGLICAVLQSCAAVEALLEHDLRMAIVWACYALAGVALALR